jgi:hypothetical protein
MGIPATPGADHDHDLLEGLFQLVVSGHTDSSDYAQLNAEIYERLLDTYAAPARAGHLPDDDAFF